MTDVHTEHCCVVHGCKYGNKDCTVTTGKAPQSFACEECHDDLRCMGEPKAYMVAGEVYASKDLELAKTFAALAGVRVIVLGEIGVL